jgi:hypothetical protein
MNIRRYSSVYKESYGCSYPVPANLGFLVFQVFHILRNSLGALSTYRAFLRQLGAVIEFRYCSDVEKANG